MSVDFDTNTDTLLQAAGKTSPQNAPKDFLLTVIEIHRLFPFILIAKQRINIDG